MTYTLTYKNMDYIITTNDITERNICKGSLKENTRCLTETKKRRKKWKRKDVQKKKKKEMETALSAFKRTKDSITAWIGNLSGKDPGYVGDLNVVKGYIDRMEEVSSTKGMDCKKWEKLWW